jgi:hypothetical protein
MGTSTYNKNFIKHNPEEMLPSSPFKTLDNPQKTPASLHQFGTMPLNLETSYNKEFHSKISPLCPSKIMLDRQQYSAMGQCKGLFK